MHTAGHVYIHNVFTLYDITLHPVIMPCPTTGTYCMYVCSNECANLLGITAL